MFKPYIQARSSKVCAAFLLAGTAVPAHAAVMLDITRQFVSGSVTVKTSGQERSANLAQTNFGFGATVALDVQGPPGVESATATAAYNVDANRVTFDMRGSILSFNQPVGAEASGVVTVRYSIRNAGLNPVRLSYDLDHLGVSMVRRADLPRTPGALRTAAVALDAPSRLFNFTGITLPQNGIASCIEGGGAGFFDQSCTAASGHLITPLQTVVAPGQTLEFLLNQAMFGHVSGIGDVLGDRFTASFTGSRLDFTGEELLPPPPIPEPATWALMIAGFGLAGSAARRRRAPARALN